MADKTPLRRPSRAMMLAVNAAIERKDREVARLIKEHDLDPAELEQRLIVRDGRQYDLDGPKKRRHAAAEVAPRSSGLATAEALPDLNVTIDGRTSVARLFRIIEDAERLKGRAQQELKRRPPEKIEPVKKALAEIELLRREREKLEDKIRSAQETLV